MEDQFSVAYQESPITHELEYAFFGIYDGHGGPEAALFAKEHLMLEIVKQKQFWSDQDEDVLRAIREGYIATHFAMWREQGEQEIAGKLSHLTVETTQRKQLVGIKILNHTKKREYNILVFVFVFVPSLMQFHIKIVANAKRPLEMREN